MRKSEFTETLIIFAHLKAEEGVRIALVCRKMGICAATSNLYEVHD